MTELHEKNIMTAQEALSVLSDIARGRRSEEVLMMDPTTGDVKRIEKKADNATVIKAITEILRRYPAILQAKKLEKEIELLQAKIDIMKGSKPDTHLMEKLLEVIDGKD